MLIVISFVFGDGLPSLVCMCRKESLRYFLKRMPVSFSEFLHVIVAHLFMANQSQAFFCTLKQVSINELHHSTLTFKLLSFLLF